MEYLILLIVCGIFIGTLTLFFKLTKMIMFNVTTKLVYADYKRTGENDWYNVTLKRKKTPFDEPISKQLEEINLFHIDITYRDELIETKLCKSFDEALLEYNKLTINSDTYKTNNNMLNKTFICNAIYYDNELIGLFESNTKSVFYTIYLNLKGSEVVEVNEVVKGSLLLIEIGNFNLPSIMSIKSDYEIDRDEYMNNYRNFTQREV